MPRLIVLSVFTDVAGRFGNELGVVPDGAAVPHRQRQEIAARLGFSEIVFLDDIEQARLRLCTPASELPYAGHPLVGVGWWLSSLRSGVDRLRPPVGDVAVCVGDDGLCWIEGRPEWCPPWQHVRLSSPEAVAAATSPPTGCDAVQVWAFMDEETGLVRARVFAPRLRGPRGRGMRLRITAVVRASRPSSHRSSRQRLGGLRATRIGGHDRTRWKSLQAKTASSIKSRHIAEQRCQRDAHRPRPRPHRALERARVGHRTASCQNAPPQCSTSSVASRRGARSSVGSPYGAVHHRPGSLTRCGGSGSDRAMPDLGRRPGLAAKPIAKR